MPAWNRISFRVIWRVVRGICRCYRYRSKVEADERITNDAQEGDPGKGHDICRPGTRKRARYPGVAVERVAANGAFRHIGGGEAPDEREFRTLAERREGKEGVSKLRSQGIGMT